MQTDHRYSFWPSCTTAEDAQELATATRKFCVTTSSNEMPYDLAAPCAALACLLFKKEQTAYAVWLDKILAHQVKASLRWLHQSWRWLCSHHGCPLQFSHVTSRACLVKASAQPARQDAVVNTNIPGSGPVKLGLGSAACEVCASAGIVVKENTTDPHKGCCSDMYYLLQRRK